MSNWKKYKLGEIITLHYGKSLPERKRISGNIPVYSSAGLIGWHNKALVNSRGIIVGRKGTIGKIYKSNKPFFPIDTCYYILPDDSKYDFNFLFYLLNKLQLTKLNEDSAVPGLNRETAYNQEIELPPLPEQKAIAEVLSSLDDKIDLLHRQNKTLEEMAQTLFRQWFVEEAKEDWEEVMLGSIIKIGSGKGLNKDKYIDNGKYPVLGANGVIGRTNKYLFDDRLIYTGRVGTLGNVFRVENKKVWLSDNTLVIKPMKYYNYVYFILKNAKLGQFNVGSTQPLVRQSDVKEIIIKIAPAKKHLEFENISDLYFQKIYNNQQQIRTLEKLRDTLLPKLMSGEVRVKSKYFSSQ